jgi:thiol-disulfide isomerase/thioredoxin
MDKKILMISLIILLAIGGGITYLLNSSADKDAVQEMAMQAQQQNPQTTTSNTEPAPVSTEPGVYKDYDAAAIADSDGTKLLFFHAPWCPQCRALEADIIKQGVPSGVVIIKVDYDDNQSLRQKYGVTIQTTVVRVDDQGNLIEKYVSYDEPTLDAVKRNLL